MFFLGIASWMTFDAFDSATTSDAFCAEACHSMDAFVRPEWMDSSHFSNRSGVRTTCADCHVPNAFVPKMVNATIRVRDLYHEIMGTIRSREEFEAHRLRMADRVWNEMRRTDSQNCRACHDILAMDMEKQGALKHSQVPSLGRYDLQETKDDCFLSTRR